MAPDSVHRVVADDSEDRVQMGSGRIRTSGIARLPTSGACTVPPTPGPSDRRLRIDRRPEATCLAVHEGEEGAPAVAVAGSDVFDVVAP